MYISYMYNIEESIMDIIISNASGKPIYEQITEQIKEQIMNGELNEGDPLPSMRALAQQLRISIITTKRAYEELEREGFIESFTGKGSFVAARNRELFREENLRQIEQSLTLAVGKAKLCGVSYEELSEILKMLFEGDE